MYEFLIDGLDVDWVDDEDANFVVSSNTSGWNGPQTPETRALQTLRIQEHWDASPERKKAQAEWMRANRSNWTVRPHLNGMSDEHRAKLSAAAKGNTNGIGKHNYPANRASRNPKITPEKGPVFTEDSV